jgi:hypothetical protein
MEPRIRKAILRIVPQDGSRIGNQRLIEQVLQAGEAEGDTFTADAVHGVREQLDTDYNGLVFCASQVFFPRTAAWDNLKKSLKADFDPDVWGRLAGTESEPFSLGEQRHIAMKVIDERGNQLMTVREAPRWIARRSRSAVMPCGACSSVDWAVMPCWKPLFPAK